jgi:hypothetical protein
MFEVDRSLDFDAPVSRVWEVFMDLENWGEWSETKSFFGRKSRMSFAVAEGSLRGPGMKITANNKRGHAHTLIIQEWDKPNRVRFETFEPGETQGFKLLMTWKFSPKTAISTHLDYHLEFDFEIPSVLNRFVQGSAEKRIDDIFTRSRKFL